MEGLLGNDEKESLYPQRASSPDGPRQTGYHSAMPPKKLLPLLGVIAFLSGLAFVLAKDQTQEPLRFLSTSRSSAKVAQNIRLKTVQEPYVAVRDPQRRYSWSSDAFMPAKGHNEREHAVPIFPRQAVLDGLPDSVSPEEIVFGFTTPYKRAREMSTTWKHFLQYGSQCLIVMPREEEPYRREMEFYLAKEGLEHCRVATVDLGQYQRYEHRVLNMPRAMSEQRWTTRSGEPVMPKWYVVVDDDSQVLDMRLLQREMASRLNQEDHMLCAVTESVTQLGRHGKICYGGGGILMSAGLVKKMADKMFDCMWLHHWRFGGDEMLTHCAATATNTAPEKAFTDITGLHRKFSSLSSEDTPDINHRGRHSGRWIWSLPVWSALHHASPLHRLARSLSSMAHLQSNEGNEATATVGRFPRRRQSVRPIPEPLQASLAYT